MVRNTTEARKLGRLGKGKAKSFADPEAAIEQRRQAGIASGKSRKFFSDLAKECPLRNR